MSPCSTCLHPPPPRTVMLILIFNSTAYCHAHSLILYILYSVLYILFFIHYILCILPLLYSTIFALSMERTWFTFHCWLYNLCIVVYVTNKTWNLNLKLKPCSVLGLTQRSPTLFLEIYLPPEFSSWSNTPVCNYQVLLQILVSWFRCVWSGLELNSPGTGLSSPALTHMIAYFIKLSCCHFHLKI